MAKGMALPKGGNFRGWYCKHTGKDGMLALILGRWEAGGTGGCFLQAITEEGSWRADFPLSAWWEANDLRRPRVRLGSSYFTPSGCWLDVEEPGLRLHGQLRYGPLQPLGWDIMGPFVLLPHLECRHLVVSTAHRVEGQVRLFDRELDFSHGMGYWEGDRGCSFPRQYMWLQCNRFAQKGCALTAAVADVPVGPWTIEGCLLSLRVRGEELRLATYLGAKVLCREPGKVVLRQGDWCVTLRWQPGEGHPLAAPQQGEMSRTIREQPSIPMTVDLRCQGEPLLHLQGVHASVEMVDPPVRV